MRFEGRDPDRWVLKSEIEHNDHTGIARTTIHFGEIHRCGDMSDEELEANACAIAALPDLIAAIEGLGVLPEGYCFCFGHGRDATKTDREHTGECRALRSALLKAKGGEG